MRRQTLSRCLALSLLAAFLTPPATPAQTQERKAAPPEAHDVKGGCPSPVVNLTIAAGTTPNVYKPDFPQVLFNGQTAGLNDLIANRPFLHTFEWKKDDRCCRITQARLTVKMKSNDHGTPGGPNAANDGIYIVHNQLVVAPFSEAVYIPPPPPSFPIGHPSFKQWTLLPSGSSAPALANLNAYRRLSFYVQDDTRVESATLQLWGCCLGGPVKDATEQGIVADTQKQKQK
jgi:hypothetical protein